MPTFVPGQRWISDTEPELGLGTVLAFAENRVTILYIASSERRVYAAANAPLTRVHFVPGDKVESIDGWVLQVTAVAERDGILTYVGTDPSGAEKQLEELELNPFLQFNKPQDRLLAGQVDAPTLFRLRIETLQRVAELEQSGIRGLVGPRTSPIPHQLYIAHQVAERHAPRVLLADEVGLGKTIEAGMIVHHRLLTGRADRVLLIVPESLLHQWLVEMRRRFNLYFALFDDARCDAIGPDNPFGTEPLILTGLEFLLRHPKRAEQALAVGWDLCVFDEAHHLSYDASDPSPAYQFAEHLATRTSGLLLLTATPEQYGKLGHFARLRLIDPDRFHDFEQFRADEHTYTELADVIDHLLDDTHIDAELYRRLGRVLALDRADDLIARIESESDGGEARHELIQLLLDRHGTGRVLFRNTRDAVQGFPQRRVFGHPQPFPDDYADTVGSGPEAINHALYPERAAPKNPDAADWWRGDARIRWLNGFVKAQPNRKFLIICARADTAGDIETALRTLGGVRVAAFTEVMSIIARDRAAAWFADDEDGAQALVCSEIGSEGRNFQFAHDLVLFDLPLNPDLLEQRIGRLDRIGQTETICIHVPYFGHSAQHRLFRWFDEGLNSFAAPCGAAQQVYNEYAEELQAALVEPADSPIDDLIRRTAARTRELSDELQRGRDRLLELNSCREAEAQDLVRQIEARDREPDLWNYLERVFDAYGVNVEDHSAGCYILTPSEHLRVSHFPELSDDGATVTTVRSVALAREDMQFLTWEHPMVRGAMDLLLNSEHGNASISLVSSATLPPGQMFIETYHVVEAPAPRALQVGRFLPPTLIRILLDRQGRERDEQFDDIAGAESGTMPPDEVRELMHDHRHALTKLLQHAATLAQQRLPTLLQQAQQSMLKAMTMELKRLAALRRVNPSVRQEELDELKERGLALHHSIQSARLRLDALRIVVTV